MVKELKLYEVICDHCKVSSVSIHASSPQKAEIIVMNDNNRWRKVKIDRVQPPGHYFKLICPGC